MNQERPPSPAFALVRREMLVLSRNQGLFGLLAAMTGILVLATVVLLLWTSSTNAAMANFARNLYRTQFFLLFATALIVVPGAAAASMVSERRQDCFSLLYTTLIPPAWIVWSKALALTGLFAGLFIGVLPFSGLVYFFAGVETAALFHSAIVLFSLALGTAGIGLLASSYANDHGRALYLAGVGVTAMVLFPLTLRVIVQNLPLPPMAWLEYLDPVHAYSAVSSGMAEWTSSLAFATYEFGVAAVTLLLARDHVLPEHANWKERIGRRIALPAPRTRVPRIRDIGDGQNPIAAKDHLMSSLARGYRPYALGLFGVAAGSFLSIPNYLTAGAAGFGSSSMAGTIVSIVLPPIMAIQFMAEREQDMWDPLRCTLLSGRDVVWGKLQGAWLVLRPLILGVAAGELALYILAYLTGVFPGALPNVLSVALGIVGLLLSTGTTAIFSLFGAAHRQSMTAAIVMAYVASFLLPMLASIPFSMLMLVVYAAGGPNTFGNGNAQLLGLTAILFNVLLAALIYRSTVRVVENKLAASR